MTGECADFSLWRWCAVTVRSVVMTLERGIQ